MYKLFLIYLLLYDVIPIPMSKYQNNVACETISIRRKLYSSSDYFTSLSENVITTNPSEPRSVFAIDLDGDGEDDPIITNGTLAANTTYSGSLDLLNETESPAESITEEIEEEALEHQFFFDVSNDLFSVAYDDMDADGNPIGLDFIVTTDATTGTEAFTITLRHEPSKDAAGVSAGDITNAGGETDIEVTFNVTVQ